MKKPIVLVISAVLIAALGVGGGVLLSTKLGLGRSRFGTFGANGMPSGFPNGGPNGSNNASGTAGVRGMRGGLLEGTVTSSDAEKVKVKLAAGGSSTVYVDSSTVIAAVEGATPKVATGASVMISAQPEASGVSAAKAIIITK